MKRKRVTTTLNQEERAMLRRVRRFVKQHAAIDSDAEALRFLVRNWSSP